MLELRAIPISFLPRTDPGGALQDAALTHMALAAVLTALAAVAYSHPTTDRSLLFGSTPSDGSSSAPPATPTDEPSTSWSPHTAPATCAAGVDTSPSCPYDSVGDNIKICPAEFPTFTPSNEVAPICEIAVIGASPATITLLTHTHIMIAVAVCAHRRRDGRLVHGTAPGGHGDGCRIGDMHLRDDRSRGRTHHVAARPRP